MMSGMNIFDIKEMLGHSEMKTTLRYAHLSPDHLTGRTDVLDRFKKDLVTQLSDDY